MGAAAGFDLRSGFERSSRTEPGKATGAANWGRFSASDIACVPSADIRVRLALMDDAQ
jgi:hypothetical protein